MKRFRARSWITPEPVITLWQRFYTTKTQSGHHFLQNLKRRPQANGHSLAFETCHCNGMLTQTWPLTAS